MCKNYSSTALLLAAGLLAIQVSPAAAAQELIPAQITQNAGTWQTATTYLNTPTLKGARVSQSASNASNVIDLNSGGARSVYQMFDGSQISENDLIQNTMSALASLEQSASNVSGAIVAGNIDSAEQIFADGASQLARNDAELSYLPENVSQSGANTINMIYSTESVSISSQVFSEHASQTVDNILSVNSKGGTGDIVQTGNNLGNVIVAGTVGEVVREFSGDQIINNTVTLPKGQAYGSISQSGLNIANYIEAESVGSVRQTSSGTQNVVNTVQTKSPSGTLASVTGPNISQTSSNYVNVIVLKKTLPDDSSAVVDVVQTAEYDQNVSGFNAGTQQTGNAASIER